MRGCVGSVGIAVFLAIIPVKNLSGPAFAQDVPGIEICTVEKTMERRTSCLQSNVEFLHNVIAKLTTSQQQKQDAANRQIEGLKAAVIALQKTVAELQAAKAQAAADPGHKADEKAEKDKK
ncbi:MAG: hypothetical protein FWD68_07540 [Alphaproteobacteria bacterium]|nr:hypothetical protein [Alphaproteobacteria bacterium]